MNDQLTTAKGTLVRYLTNKHDDYDGLVIKQAGANQEFKFPPHVARFVKKIADQRDKVEISFHEKPHPGKRQLASIKNVTSNKSFDVHSVPPPHPPETGRLVSFEIESPQFVRGGKHDEIVGILYQDNFIHFHPEDYDEEEETWLSAPILYLKVRQRTSRSGFVNANGYKVYHIHSLLIGYYETT